VHIDSALGSCNCTWLVGGHFGQGNSSHIVQVHSKASRALQRYKCTSMPMQCALALPKCTHRILVHSLSAFPLGAMECTLVMMVHLYHGSALNSSVAGIIIVTPSWDAVEILRSFMFPILFSEASE